MNRSVCVLVNRTDKAFNFSYDGVGYQIPANGELSVTREVGDHARKKSIMGYDMETGRAKYQVGIEGVHDTSSVGKGKAADEELIDRESDPDGDHARVINVRGGKMFTEPPAGSLASEEE